MAERVNVKFESGGVYRHKNCLDTFITVGTVAYDNGETASLWAYWLTQGTNGYWYCQDSTNHFINQLNYDLWYEYEPTGELCLT